MDAQAQAVGRFVVYVWIIVCSVLALTVLGAAIAFQLSYPTGAIPQALVNWGGIILGFYFGSFLTVVKDIVVGREEAAKAASAESGASDAGKQSGNAPPVAAVAR